MKAFRDGVTARFGETAAVRLLRYGVLIVSVTKRFYLHDRPFSNMFNHVPGLITLSIRRVVKLTTQTPIRTASNLKKIDVATLRSSVPYAILILSILKLSWKLLSSFGKINYDLCHSTPHRCGSVKAFIEVATDATFMNKIQPLPRI